jgi:hypothetical protein
MAVAWKRFDYHHIASRAVVSIDCLESLLVSNTILPQSPLPYCLIIVEAIQLLRVITSGASKASFNRILILEAKLHVSRKCLRRTQEYNKIITTTKVTSIPVCSLAVSICSNSISRMCIPVEPVTVCLPSESFQYVIAFASNSIVLVFHIAIGCVEK